MMNCVILAGGQGTRLQPVVKDVPKPMANIAGRPFIEFILGNFARFGVSEFVICVSHMRQAIISHIGHSFQGIPVRYSIEEKPLGTGGAIWKAFMDFEISDALVANGDTYLDADYELFNAECQGCDLGMLLTHVADASRFGIVETEKEYILGFKEKGEVSGPGWINAGVYHMEKSLITAMPLVFSFEKDFLMPRIKEIRPKFIKTAGYFIDIGVPESYSRACRELPGIV